jgi:hypothetical protein
LLKSTLEAATIGNTATSMTGSTVSAEFILSRPGRGKGIASEYLPLSIVLPGAGVEVILARGGNLDYEGGLGKSLEPGIPGKPALPGGTLEGGKQMLTDSFAQTGGRSAWPTLDHSQDVAPAAARATA